MKNISLRQTGLSLLAGWALAHGGLSLQAESDYVVDLFDNPDEAAAWVRWWGSAQQTYEYDGLDADGNANSGSLKATIGFDLAAYAGDNQFCVQRPFDQGAVLDGTKYTTLVFDLRFDPGSPVNAAGNLGSLEFGLRANDSSWTSIPLGPLTVPTSATNGWMHVSAPIDPTAKLIDSLAGVWLKVWSGGDGGLTGNTVFWVDNMKLIGNTNEAVELPTLTLSRKVTPGLQLVASASGQQYQRQSISTLAMDTNGAENAYSWVGRSQPVTYSMTVKEFPDTAHNGFQAHLFIVPNGSMPYGSKDTSLDWNAANLVFFQVTVNAEGEAVGRFMYKTNLPSGNSMLWNADPANGPVGTLAYLTNSAAVGSWSISFSGDTQVVMTSPSGSSTNFTFPAEAAALFADPVTVYYGVQPNQLTNIGQSAVFSRLAITGAGTALDDSFKGSELDASLWQVVAADAGGVSVTPADAAFWLSWNAPAIGFGLEASPSLQAGSWYDPGLTNIVQVSGQKKVLVPKSATSAGAAFYRLKK